MNNCKSKKVIAKIIKEERERQEQIEKLKQELKELEAQGEMCDTKKMIKIIDELNIIDPLLEYEENRKDNKKKKRKYLFLKISAACMVIVVSVQITAMAAFNINILNSVYEWTRDTFLSLIGVEIQQDNVNLAVSSSKIYNTVEEFETAENISILCPIWLPDDLNVEYIFYSQDNQNKMLNIAYDDSFSSLIIYFDVKLLNHDTLDNYMIFNTNGIDFYVFKNGKTIQWIYENNTYILTYNFAENEIQKIINNIK